jgi:hypothetical protein
MKTTIKIDLNNSLTIEPMGGGVLLGFVAKVLGVPMTESRLITPDQAGAIIFALENALPAKDQQHQARAAFEASAG